jgi:hypothetical protein
MPLIPTLTPLQRSTQSSAEAIHYAASVLKSAWDAVWLRDPATVAAELNSDPTAPLLMQLHEQSATAINALLDAVSDPRYSTRVPIGMPAHWTFEDGLFAYNPPEPEQEP